MAVFGVAGLVCRWSRVRIGLASEASRGELLVHVVDLSQVYLMSDVSLELESWRYNVIIDAERFRSDKDFLGFLEAVQFAERAKTCDLVHHQFLKVSVLLRQHSRPVFSVRCRPLLTFFHLGHDNSDTAVSHRIAPYEALRDVV